MFGILSGGIRCAKARRICRRQCPIRYSLWPAQCRREPSGHDDVEVTLAVRCRHRQAPTGRRRAGGISAQSLPVEALEAADPPPHPILDHENRILEGGRPRQGIRQRGLRRRDRARCISAFASPRRLQRRGIPIEAVNLGSGATDEVGRPNGTPARDSESRARVVG
jgi:hypothetical protein